MKKFNLRKKILALTLTAITMFSTITGLLPGGVVHAADASSGTYYGIDWDMDVEGNLVLHKGTATNGWATNEKWNNSKVKTVKTDGPIVIQTNKFCPDLFRNCTAESIDLSDFDTSSVNNMKDMFYRCSNLTSLNVSSFDTSNVTNMDYMLDCPKLETLDISSFVIKSSPFGNIPNVKYLKTPKTINSSDIQLRRSPMYDEDKNPHTKMDIENTWLFINKQDCPEQSTHAGVPYTYYSHLKTVVLHEGIATDNDPWQSLPTSATTVITDGHIVANNNFCQLFRSTGFNNANTDQYPKAEYIDLSDVDTSAVTNMHNMFGNCTNLSYLNIQNFDTSNVTNMECMFYNCKALQKIDLSNFNTAEVENMYGMFCGCESVNSLNVSTFNTSKVTNMCRMFENCKHLSKLNISNFDTSNVTHMGEMFAGYGGSSVDLSNFNTANVTNMNGMFWGSSQRDINISNFDTRNVTDMSNMFKECRAYTIELPFAFGVKAAYMGNMFQSCIYLDELDLRYLHIGKNTVTNGMLASNYYIKRIKTPHDLQNTDIYLPTTMYDYNKSSHSKMDIAGTVLYNTPTDVEYVFEEYKIEPGGEVGSSCINMSGINAYSGGDFHKAIADSRIIYKNDEDIIKDKSIFYLSHNTKDNFDRQNHEFAIVGTSEAIELYYNLLEEDDPSFDRNNNHTNIIKIDKSDIDIITTTRIAILNENTPSAVVIPVTESNQEDIDSNATIYDLPEGQCALQIMVNYKGKTYKLDPELFNLLPNNVESTTTNSIEASYDENNNLVVKANQTDTYTSGKKVTKTVDIDTYGVTDQGTTLLITYDGASTEIEKIVNIEGTLLYNDNTPVQRKVVKLSTPKDMFDLSSDEGHYEFANVPITNNTMPLSVFDTDDTSACSDDILLTSGVVTFDNTGTPVLDNDSSKEMTLIIEKVTPTVPEREEVVVPTPEIVPTPKPSATTTIVVPEPIVDNTNIIGDTNTESTPNIETSAPAERITVNTLGESTKPEIKNAASKNDTISEKPEQNNEKLTDFSKNSEKDNSAVKDDTEDKIEQSSLDASKDTKSINNILIIIACIFIILFFAWLIHSLRKNTRL